MNSQGFKHASMGHQWKTSKHLKHSYHFTFDFGNNWPRKDRKCWDELNQNYPCSQYSQCSQIRKWPESLINVLQSSLYLRCMRVLSPGVVRFYHTFQFSIDPHPPSLNSLSSCGPLCSRTASQSGQDSLLALTETRIHTAFLCLHSSGGHIQNTDIKPYPTYEEL